MDGCRRLASADHGLAKRRMQPTGTTQVSSAAASAKNRQVKSGSTTAADCPMALSSEAKGFDDGTIPLDIVAFDVVEQSTTLAHQHQQPPAGVVIFFMHLQMFGQIGDSVGEQSNLNFRGAGIGIVLFVFFNQSFFGFRCNRPMFRPP